MLAIFFSRHEQDNDYDCQQFYANNGSLNHQQRYDTIHKSV